MRDLNDQHHHTGEYPADPADRRRHCRSPKISKIAEQIADGRKTMKFVMIAGPSSSGKTTFSHRLSIQLCGAWAEAPSDRSLDNYFVNREDTPLDEIWREGL